MRLSMRVPHRIGMAHPPGMSGQRQTRRAVATPRFAFIRAPRQGGSGGDPHRKVDRQGVCKVVRKVDCADGPVPPRDPADTLCGQAERPRNLNRNRAPELP
ncbi:hypothetical protein JCM16408A_19660 [Methylobacterium phyllosphaerae]